MKQLVVKEGPLVFVRRLIFAEIFFAFLFFSISFITNYEEFYRNIGLVSILRYDIFLMLGFSLFQIILIMAIFLEWYFSYFEIYTEDIVHVGGIIKRTRTSYPISHLQNISVKQGLLESKMRHATLVLSLSSNRTLRLRNIAFWKEAEEILKSSLHTNNHKLSSVDGILSADEGAKLEFKETLRYDIKTNQVNREVERASIKTIASFMNSHGGTLVVGVDDKKNIKGLDRDFETLKRKDKDGFENYLTVLIRNHLGADAIHNISVMFFDKGEKSVAVVNVIGASIPIYVRGFDNNKEDFFVRTGNSTQPLSMSEAQGYIKRRW